MYDVHVYIGEYSDFMAMFWKDLHVAQGHVEQRPPCYDKLWLHVNMPLRLVT